MAGERLRGNTFRAEALCDESYGLGLSWPSEGVLRLCRAIHIPSLNAGTNSQSPTKASVFAVAPYLSPNVDPRPAKTMSPKNAVPANANSRTPARTTATMRLNRNYCTPAKPRCPPRATPPASSPPGPGCTRIVQENHGTNFLLRRAAERGEKELSEGHQGEDQRRSFGRRRDT
jgi:hypothetical protein